MQHISMPKQLLIVGNLDQNQRSVTPKAMAAVNDVKCNGTLQRCVSGGTCGAEEIVLEKT